MAAIGRQHQRHGPLAATVLGIVLLFFTVFSLVFLFQSISAAQRSHEVQNHGIRTAATVVSIHH